MKNNEKVFNFPCVLMPIFGSIKKLPSVRFPEHKFTMLNLRIEEDKRIRRVEQFRCRFSLSRASENPTENAQISSSSLVCEASTSYHENVQHETKRRFGKINIKILSFSFQTFPPPLVFILFTTLLAVFSILDNCALWIFRTHHHHVHLRECIQNSSIHQLQATWKLEMRKSLFERALFTI